LDDTPLWLLVGLFVFLLAAQAFLSGTETGMMALNRYRLKHLAMTHAGARRAQRLLNRPDRLLGFILVSVNAVTALASIIASIICARLFGPELGIAIATVALTILLGFAEVTPKTIAARRPETIAFAASPILKPLMIAFYPAVWLVTHVSNGIARLLGFDPDEPSQDALSKEELRSIVDESTSEQISAHHQEMLISILDLEKVSVNDIMVPRTEIYGLNLDDDVEKLMDQILTSEHTRLPVFEGDINNVIGLLHMRRASRLVRSGIDSLSKEAIKRFSREPYFVPENTPLHTQLINFRKNKRRMALVVDEYGEVQGLVTLEDILEEIVGDFTSNFAEEEDVVVAQPDGSYIIHGSATIRDINKVTDWHLPIDGPRTLNGLALEQLESIPEGNVCFALGHHHFETLKLSDKKIARVRAVLVTAADMEAD
jgi:Mg2+/Co2+ transporter CorB